MAYGVVPTGFSRKPLAVVLAEIEQSNISEFGSQIIQTEQSPFGQFNGLRSDLIAVLWEFAEETYQSYDPDQSEGVPLQRLGRLRLLEQQEGEPVDTYRRAITNQGRARIDLQDIKRAVQNIIGVSYVHVFVNDSNETDANGQERKSIAVAVIGGNDAEIATVVRAYTVPGINSYGNTAVQTVINGYCRQINLIRPVSALIHLALDVRTKNDVNDCPPPSPEAIEIALAAELMGTRLNADGQPTSERLANGEDVTLHALRTAAAQIYGSQVEIVDAFVGVDVGPVDPAPFILDFFEIADFNVDRISVTVVP